MTQLCLCLCSLTAEKICWFFSLNVIIINQQIKALGMPPPPPIPLT